MGENAGVRFLSPEWLDRISAALAGASPGAAVSIHQRVTGGPDGDVEYTVRLHPGAVAVEPGPGTADVEIVQSYETAAAISQGRPSPAAAFAAGRLRLVGEVGPLVAHHEAVAALGPLLAGLAGETTY
jgi:hypothetical protein